MPAVELIGLDRWGVRNRAAAVIDNDHQICPYADATRGNIDVDPRVG